MKNNLRLNAHYKKEVEIAAKVVEMLADSPKLDGDQVERLLSVIGNELNYMEGNISQLEFKKIKKELDSHFFSYRV